MKIPLFKVFMSPEAGNRVKEVLESGYIGEGPQVVEFEKELFSYFLRNVGSTPYTVITTNTGTSAEHLLYYYLKNDRELVTDRWNSTIWETITWKGIKEDEHVLSVPLTCTATNWPIITNGLNLRWVDVDPITCNISPEDLKRQINNKTRIVTLVHWGGSPADLDSIKLIVEEAEEEFGTKILIIEDCAHGFGASYRGNSLGFTGNLATFSLQAIKHINSVDGGFIATPYRSMDKALRFLRWYGIDRDTPRADFRCESDISEVGFKFHMNDVSAAVGRSNLQYADRIVASHQSNAAYYNEQLENINGLTLSNVLPHAKSSYWLYTFHAERRDDLMKHLSDHGIASSRVHERNDKHSAVRCFSRDDLFGVDQAVRTMISIPVGYWVGQEEREYIVDVITKGW